MTAASSSTKKKQKSGASPWTVVISKDLAEEGARIAIEVADRFLEGDKLADNIRMLPSQSTETIPVGMGGAGLMQGFSGLSLLYSQLRRCQPDEDWNSPAAHFLKISAEYVAEGVNENDISICSGASGVAYAALQSYRGKSTFKKLIAKSNQLVLDQIQGRIDKVSAPGGLAAFDYDALYGIAGIGRYLLAAGNIDERFEGTLDEILKVLIARSKLVDGYPGLYNAVGDLTASEKETYGCSVVNCGLAHGVPGVLTLLALSLREGRQVKGLREAVEFWAGWLQERAVVEDEWGVNWPCVVPVDGRDLQGARAAWCYGAPGVANSIWLAGEALDDEQSKNAAVKAMEAVFRRPFSALNVISPCLCHGGSGLLQLALRFAARTGLPVFTEASENWLGRILAEYDPENSYWGFSDTLPGGQKTDLPTLLNGATGVILPVLAASFPQEPIWDQVLLLS